jgi:hypothetical protein
MGDIWRNVSTTYEFDVDGVARDVGDDAVEEELVVAAELLLDGGCREGKLRNRAKKTQTNMSPVFQGKKTKKNLRFRVFFASLPSTSSTQSAALDPSTPPPSLSPPPTSTQSPTYHHHMQTMQHPPHQLCFT